MNLGSNKSNVSNVYQLHYGHYIEFCLAILIFIEYNCIHVIEKIIISDKI